jgi:transcriptional regulator with XRE-family HTH domain
MNITRYQLEAMGKTVGAQIHQLRTDRGWSLAQLNRECRVSVSYLSQIERGIGSPRLETLMRIAMALGATIELCCQQTVVNE